MKVKFEIDLSSQQDVMDAVKVIEPFVENKGVLNATNNTDVVFSSDIENHIDNQSDVMKAEIEELKEKLSEAKNNNKSLVDENSMLKQSNEALKLEVESTPIITDDMIPDIPEMIVDNSDCSEQIAKLEEEVEFHKNRSKQNWDELKALKLKNKELENIIESKDQEIENAKVMATDVSSDELESIKLEKEQIEEKLKNMESLKVELLKDVDFHKNRSKQNWDELKALKLKNKELENNSIDIEKKVKELEAEANNINNKEDMDKLKSELFQMKSDYESKIGELKLNNDKLINEINLSKLDNNSGDTEELDHLKKMKNTICANQNGLDFWNKVEMSLNR